MYDIVYYGTLKSEIERLWAQGKHVLFDIDVHGAQSLKEQFGDQALTIFVEAPSIEELSRRLKARNTDSEESIQKRIAKYSEEIQYADSFDNVILNDDIDLAVLEAEQLIQNFID